MSFALAASRPGVAATRVTASIAARRVAPTAARLAPLRPAGAFKTALTGLCSSFAGVSLAPARRPSTSTSPSTSSRSPLTVEANAKTCLGCTKRGTRRRATRTSGFRARMSTPTGRGVLKARRKKGRKTLCTKTLYKK